MATPRSTPGTPTAAATPPRSASPSTTTTTSVTPSSLSSPLSTSSATATTPRNASGGNFISRFLKSKFRWVALVGCVLMQVQWGLQNRYSSLTGDDVNTTARRLDRSSSHTDVNMNLQQVDLEFLGHSTTTKPSPSQQVINVLFGMHGANEFFIDEWEVAFKSVLMNAPLDAPLHIHIVANAEAHDAVKQRLDRHELIGSFWRNSIIVTIYNVEHRQEEFQQILQHGLRGNVMDARVSIGGYYRLLAPLVLPAGTGPVVYMDADAVVMANLGDLWKHVNTSYTFQASATWLCSAFIIINIDRAIKFWELLDEVPKVPSGGDQVLLREVANYHKGVMGPLPPEWDTHLGHGHRDRPHQVLKKRKQGVGMLHFNGARPNYFSGHEGLNQYCSRTRFCKDDRGAQKLFEQTWMLADYYIKMPWEWAKYIGGKSKIPHGQEGYPLQYVEVYSNSTSSSAGSATTTTTTTREVKPVAADDPRLFRRKWVRTSDNNETTTSVAA